MILVCNRNLMTYTNCMYQEKKEEDDLPALKIALMCRYDNSNTS